ncbi:MAG: hypothetical protein QOI06_1152, partial [Nocardioidaceae bacterium]|nr:hypothetical protein [Nocardioidaceae bacterium]
RIAGKCTLAGPLEVHFPAIRGRGSIPDGGYMPAYECSPDPKRLIPTKLNRNVA